uniref:Uncharacterized protein n=1 Tax=Arundo donax TaxID=35708 RepID=A0A0A8Z942_ARUDO
MTVKPTTPLAPHLAAGPTKTTTVGSGKTPTPTTPWTWTWTRVLHVSRYVSLYYLINVIGMAVTVDGFKRLGAAGNVDMGARTRATLVIAAGSMLRAALSAAAGILWPSGFRILHIEFTAVTVGVVVYVVNTIDLC